MADDKTQTDESVVSGILSLAERLTPQVGEFAESEPLDLDALEQENEERRRQEAEQRELERFRGAMEAFKKFEPGQPCWICSHCGNLVADRLSHIRDHDEQKAVKEMARSAGNSDTLIAGGD